MSEQRESGPLLLPAGTPVHGSDIGWVRRLEAERDQLREGGKQLDGVIVRLSEENERLRSALERAAAGLANASEALDIAGLQVDASDARQAHRAAREALEGP